jgi:hypothetical protein
VSDLVALAKEYVAVSGQLAEIRNAMRVALANGAGGEPAKARHPIELGARPAKPSGRTKVRQNKSSSRHAQMLAQARAAEEEVLSRVRNGMTRTMEIAAATSSKTSTVSERLRRLKAKGLVVLAEGGGWAAASPP